MKIAYVLAFILLLSVNPEITAESKGGPSSKIKDEEIEESSELMTKSTEESTVDSTSDDIDSIIEQLREITGIQRTIRSLLPPKDISKTEKISPKHEFIDTEERLENSNPKKAGSWMKNIISHSSNRNNQVSQQEFYNTEDEDSESEAWNEDKLEESSEDEASLPITPQEREGIVKFFLY